MSKASRPKAALPPASAAEKRKKEKASSVPTSNKVGTEASRTRFIYDLAGALHAYGTPSHRLEALLKAVAHQLGMVAEFFAVPTAIVCAFGEPPEQKMGLIAPRQWDLDLGRLADFDEVAQLVADGEIQATEGSRRVSAILDAPPRHHALVRLLCHGVLAGGAALLLGGSLTDALTATLAGVAIGLVDLIASRSESLGRLVMPLSAALAALSGAIGATLSSHVSPTIVGIAGIIYLVPGLTLTVAMKELATGHLVSGTARLAKTFAAFMLLAAGAMVGGAAAQLWGAPLGQSPSEGLGPWWLFAVSVLSTPAALVLFSVRPRDLLAALFASVAGYLAAELGRVTGGPLLAAGLGTMALGLLGNAWARFRNRPAAVLVTPGLLLMVPGSVGFRAVSAFVADDVIGAVTLSFQVALTAIALVGGLLLANFALPPKKAL